MSTERESVLFVVNDIPDQEGTTRFQHATALCETFETIVLCGGDVPESIREISDGVRTFPESAFPAIPLLFPLWLFYWTVRIPTSVTVVSPHSLYLLTTVFGTQFSSSRHVVDFWDDLTLPVASYNDRDGTVSRLKELYHRVLLTLARRSLSQSDLLVLSIHPGIVDKYDLRSVPIIELTNGYSPALLDIEAPEKDDEVTQFVYLGRANAKRGIDQLVRTVAEAIPSHHLHIVGPTDSAVKRTASGFENVTIHGERPHSEAIRLVARADVGLCILDTTVENYQYSYPIKLFEYAALGVTILASDTPAVRSIFTDGESAILVDDRSQSAIREAITHLATDAEFRRQLKANAKEAVEGHEWPKILERYTEAITEIANEA